MKFALLGASWMHVTLLQFSVFGLQEFWGCLLSGVDSFFALS